MITPIFLHVTRRVNQGGDIASPGQPFLCIHIPCTVQQLPALCHQCHLEPSCPSQAPAQVLTGARRWQTCRPTLHQLLPYRPQALRRALLEKHLLQQTDPSEKSRCRRASGTLRPGLNRPFALPSITSLWLHWHQLCLWSWKGFTGVMEWDWLVVPLGGGEPDLCVIVSYTNTQIWRIKTISVS